MNNNVTIRKYEISDKEAVEKLMQQDQQYHINGDPDLFVPVQNYYEDDFYEDLCDENPCFAYVAEADENVVGCIICFYDDVNSHDQIYQNNIMIAEIFVSDDYKRRGIATKLFEVVKAKAEDEGMDFITLDVYGFNTVAKAFYESVGLTTNREYMKLSITPKKDEKILDKQRYHIEHEFLRDYFFEEGQDFIANLSKEYLYSTYCHHFGRHYSSNDFNCEEKRYDGYKLSILTFPKEKIHMLCRRIVYYYMDDSSDYAMYTVEYDKELRGYFLCEWQECEGGFNHINHGEIADSENDQLAKIRKLIGARTNGDASMGMVSTSVSKGDDEIFFEAAIESAIEEAFEGLEIKYDKENDDGDIIYKFFFDFDEQDIPFMIVRLADSIKALAYIECGIGVQDNLEMLKFMNYMNGAIKYVKFGSDEDGVSISYDYLLGRRAISQGEAEDIIQCLITICNLYQALIRGVAEGSITAAEAIKKVENE